MKTLFKAAVIAVCCTLASAVAQAQFTTITATNIRQSGTLISAGTVTFTAVNSSGSAIPFITGAGGLNAPTAFSCTIVNGAITGSCSIPDAALTEPANISYAITITDTASTPAESFSFQNVPNITGSTWALDQYAPAAPTNNVQPVQMSYGTGAPSGTCVSPALYLRNNSGGQLYMCVAGSYILVTESAGAGLTIPSVTSLLKGNGSGGVLAAVAGTDFATVVQVTSAQAAAIAASATPASVTAVQNNVTSLSATVASHTTAIAGLGTASTHAATDFATAAAVSSAASVATTAVEIADGALPLSGGTLTGSLILNGDPTAALQAATKQYVDALGTTFTSIQTTANNALPLSGGTMTGALVLAAAPTASSQAATKGYVDTNVTTAIVAAAAAQSTANNAVSSDGGTMTGSLTVPTLNVTNFGSSPIFTNSTPGLVPAATSADASDYLGGDGTFHIVPSGGSGSVGTPPSLQTLTDATTIAWNEAGVMGGTAILNLVHTISSRTLNLTGLANGSSANLLLKQDSTGGVTTITLGSCNSGIWYVGGSSGFTTATSFTLTSTAGASNIASIQFFSTNCYVNLR